jgi:hypothetical protein
LFVKKRERPLRVPPKDEPTLFLISERDGKDARGAVRTKEGFASTDSAWLRVDHDLDMATEAFAKFIANEGIEWGAHHAH